MKDLFLEVLKLSLAGSVFVAAVLLLRLIFRKAPRWIFCLLWALAALRLVFPFHMETELSLMPPEMSDGYRVEAAMSGFVGNTTVFYEGSADFHAAVEAGREPAFAPEGNFVVTQRGSYEEPATLGDVLSWVWLGGVVLMLGYTLVSWYLLRRRISPAVHAGGNVWESESVDSPFVLGLFRPRIYLPFGLADPNRAHVIAHEKAHLHRGDHWWKPLGFLILSVYWFNPVMWVAYVLLCRDIEGACDEKVIGSMTKEQIRAYSRALLHCSVHRKRIAACPVAFGEVGTKQRITRVMHYKKPAFWIVLTALAASAVAAVLLLTSPVEEEPPETIPPVETTETTQPLETEPPKEISDNRTYWDTPLFGEEKVFYEVLQDSGSGTCSYRFFCDDSDGTERELLTVEGATCVLSGDSDGDGLVELFAVIGNTHRLYDLMDGAIGYTELELVPDSMLPYEILLGDSALYLYKEKWIRFFREPVTYIRELAKLEASRYISAQPTGVIPEEIPEETFREGYLEILAFLEQNIPQGEQQMAYRMLLELDSNCTPETVVELTGKNAFHKLLDKRRYAREGSGEWENCLSQIGVWLELDPAGLVVAMASRQENWDAEIQWLIASNYYFDFQTLSECITKMENGAATEAEKNLAAAFRACYEAMELPVMDAEALLSGSGQQLWNAIIWDTEKTVRCFRNAEQEDIYKLRNLLWGSYRPERRSLEKCYGQIHRLLDDNRSQRETDVLYNLLVLTEFMGGFWNSETVGESFDYQRLFNKGNYVDGALAEFWSGQCKDVFRNGSPQFLLALKDWEGTEDQKDRALQSLVYAFYGEERVWLQETLKNLRESETDAGIQGMLKKLEEYAHTFG